jgi:hypothetical protein
LGGLGKASHPLSLPLSFFACPSLTLTLTLSLTLTHHGLSLSLSLSLARARSLPAEYVLSHLRSLLSPLRRAQPLVDELVGSAIPIRGLFPPILSIRAPYDDLPLTTYYLPLTTYYLLHTPFTPVQLLPHVALPIITRILIIVVIPLLSTIVIVIVCLYPHLHLSISTSTSTSTSTSSRHTQPLPPLNSSYVLSSSPS